MNINTANSANSRHTAGHGSFHHSCCTSSNHANNTTNNSYHISAGESKQNVRVLVAEDNDNNYLLVKTILRKYDVTRAVNGQEAVDAVRDSDYDIVFMDIKMPVMDGIEATMTIREFNTSIKIVALTANVFDSDKDKALSAGCNDYLTKPVNHSTLRSIVENLNHEEEN